jgi:hypothetical protein
MSGTTETTEQHSTVRINASKGAQVGGQLTPGRAPHAGLTICTSLLLGLVIITASCQRLPAGQYGVYYREVEWLIGSSSSERIKVYRIQSLVEDSMLELEYEAPFLVGDTAAVSREVSILWPFFVPYLDAHGAQRAVITATNLHLTSVGPLVLRLHATSRDVVLVKDTAHIWRILGRGASLPFADSSRQPHITDYDGSPLPFAFPPAGRHACTLATQIPVRVCRIEP